MKTRSLRLRDDRPFKIRHDCWFGNSSLNGMVWRFQIRVKVPKGTDIWTFSMRDGGPFHEHVAFQEALFAAREVRAALRRGENPNMP